MAQRHDVFVSYKSEQHGWAERLATDLVRFGFDVFVDHDTASGLKAREQWEPRLEQEIRAARHFIVLWSELIVVGSYVLKEIDMRRASGGEITIVRLDDSALPPYLDASTHQFREFVDFRAGSAAAADVGFFEWNRAVRHLAEQTLLGTESDALSNGLPARVIEIPVVVVAMTRDQAIEVAAGSRVKNEVKEGAFAQLLALLDESAPFDPDRYGDRPEDWRPFEPEPDPADPQAELADPTVEDVLYGFDRAQREWRRDHEDDFDSSLSPHVFVPFGEALRNPVTSQRARDQLQEGPALLLIDPISLVHEAVHGHVIMNGLHTLKKAFVIGLGPRVSSGLQPVQDYFRNVEGALFDGLLMTDPHVRARSLFRPSLSTCVLNVAHDFELSRWLHVASERILMSQSQRRMHPRFQAATRDGPPQVPTMGFR